MFRPTVIFPPSHASVSSNAMGFFPSWAQQTPKPYAHDRSKLPCPFSLVLPIVLRSSVPMRVEVQGYEILR